MELKNEDNQINSSRYNNPVELKADNDFSIFFFNPRVLFSCKLCRAAFPTVDTLFKHKRRKHTVRELQGIMCVIFEERFVHNEHCNDVLSPHTKELPERLKTEDPHQGNLKTEKLCDGQRQKLTENEKQIDNHIIKKQCDGTVSSATASEIPIVTSGLNSDPLLTKSNPFVLLLRMNEKEIEDAKNSLKNDASRKRKSGLDFISDLRKENKGTEMLKSENPNKKKIPIRCSPAEESHFESKSNEFIILSQFEEQQEKKKEEETVVSAGAGNDKELAENPGEHFDNVEKETGLTQLGQVRMGPTSKSSVFKQWLKKYKKDFPENLFFLDPDPLQETEPDQGQSHVKGQPQEKAPVGIGTETIFPLRCKLCNEKLETEATTKDHVVSCWLKMSDKYCSKCKKCFPNKMYFLEHNSQKHPELCAEGISDVWPSECSECRKVFKFSHMLSRHRRTHSNDPYRCTLCQKTFTCPDTLRNHNLVCHTKEKRHLKLHEEGKVCADESVRSGTKGTVKGTAKRKGTQFACQVCNFKGGTKKALKEHEKIHDESEDDEDNVEEEYWDEEEKEDSE